MSGSGLHELGRTQPSKVGYIQLEWLDFRVFPTAGLVFSGSNEPRLQCDLRGGEESVYRPRVSPHLSTSAIKLQVVSIVSVAPALKSRPSASSVSRKRLHAAVAKIVYWCRDVSVAPSYGSYL